MSLIRALVLTGFGLNCDLETAHALEVAGAQAEHIHLNNLIAGDSRLQDFQIFVIGGGFSWGDDHGAGVIMAMRLKHRMQDDILNFVHAGGLVLGICNGFQVIVNLGLLPGFESQQLKRDVAIIGNECGTFRDQWVHLRSNPASPCILTWGVDSIELPVRHGEGKFYAETEVLTDLTGGEQVILHYSKADGKPAEGEFPYNPNGSINDIAGICDPTGRIAGLMPHPEAFNHWTNHPDWTYKREELRRQGKPFPEEGDGIKMFRNLVNYFG
ncbi:MAG: phosphoribosylformylglycinamidine synthase subunit PurQ [Desulfoferrobacter sp.]